MEHQSKNGNRRTLYLEVTSGTPDTVTPAFARVLASRSLLDVARAMLAICIEHGLSSVRRHFNVENITWGHAVDESGAFAGEDLRLHKEEMEVHRTGHVRFVTESRHADCDFITALMHVDELERYLEEDADTPVFIGDRTPADWVNLIVIPTEVFEAEWGAHGPEEGGMFEFEQVSELDPKTVWTIVEGDDGNSLIAEAGFHRINRLGYVVTTKPWVTGEEQALWSEGVTPAEGGPEDDGPTQLTDITGFDTEWLGMLLGVPRPGFNLPKFEEAVRMLERPYIRLNEAQWQLVNELGTKNRTDVLLFRGIPVTWGNADDGYALMPLTQDAKSQLSL